jgi:cardiolipin synthase
VPFGDGPKPVYQRQVSKIAILSLLNNAKKCVYITTPYLIIDNELAQALENAALRGVDVRLITPHIPDKKLVFMMTRSYYPRLLDAGVHIFEYEPGFIHAKIYLADGKYALVGSVNLDYRSLVHHFENGLYIANHEVVANIEEDFLATQEKSIPFEKSMLKNNIFYRALRALVKIFAPLL